MNVTPRTKIALVQPAALYRDSFLRALAEFREEGLPWWRGGELELAERDFGAFVAKKLAEASPEDETRIPNTHLWAVTAVTESTFVGRISIHHRLDDALAVEGGHIGYDTVPSFRGRGIASEMLRQALPVAYALGLMEVLLTCDDDNAASIRVIESNGGKLRDTRVLAPSRSPKRYYVIDVR